MTDTLDLEAVAELLHQGWMDFKRRQGVAFGPERSSTTHPHFVDWSSLDNDSKNQDRFIASAILRDWARGALSPGDLPAAIHNAWAEWSRLRGENHPHAIPYFQAHSKDAGEHGIQADLVIPIIAAKQRLPSALGTRKKCLVLLPLRDHTKAVHDKILEPAIRRSGYQPVRADLLRGTQTIHEDVVDQIESCTVVIADLTDDNPNVNYEIGLARTLGRPIIMICELRSPDQVPFYYKGQRIQFYDRNRPDWEELLGLEIERSLASAIRTDPFSENQKLGLTGFFRTDDRSFEAALMREIARASRQIVAVGWGLAFLNAQRRELIKALHNQIIKEKSLTVHIILPRKDHPGLITRIQEEAAHQPEVAIHPDWPSTFFKFAMELPSGLEDWSKERVFVRRLPYLPTAMIIQLDEVFFFRCYGPPNTGGWSCPWLRCESTLASPPWRNFLRNMVAEAVANCVPEATTPGGAPDQA
jgi:nucleoside 2-deoxyribosyltransferase